MLPAAGTLTSRFYLGEGHGWSQEMVLWLFISGSRVNFKPVMLSDKPWSNLRKGTRQEEGKQKKEAEEYGNADVDGGQRGQLVPLAVAVGKHEKPLTVDMGVQCNIIDDASCHSCQKTEEKYLNEIYQLSGWVARHCFRMFLCIPMFQDYKTFWVWDVEGLWFSCQPSFQVLSSGMRTTPWGDSRSTWNICSSSPERLLWDQRSNNTWPVERACKKEKQHAGRRKKHWYVQSFALTCMYPFFIHCHATDFLCQGMYNHLHSRACIHFSVIAIYSTDFLCQGMYNHLHSRACIHFSFIAIYSLLSAEPGKR